MLHNGGEACRLQLHKKTRNLLVPHAPSVSMFSDGGTMDRRVNDRVARVAVFYSRLGYFIKHSSVTKTMLYSK